MAFKRRVIKGPNNEPITMIDIYTDVFDQMNPPVLPAPDPAACEQAFDESHQGGYEDPFAEQEIDMLIRFDGGMTRPDNCLRLSQLLTIRFLRIRGMLKRKHAE